MNSRVAPVYHYFPELEPEIMQKFEELEDIYVYWNSQINVISRRDMEHFYVHHVLHSLSIAKFVSFTPGTTILDIGTGGGFPGVPLAIMFPKSNFLLVDSIGKKIKVVNEVIGALHLNNCEAMQTRAEDLDRKFDFIVSRAVKPLPIVFSWIRNKMQSKSVNSIQNGLLYLKGGDFDDELMQLTAQFKVFNLREVYNEEFFETKKLVHIY